MSSSSTERAGFVRDALNAPTEGPAVVLAAAIEKKHPGAAVLLYGSGASVLKSADARDVLFDFYAIVPDYEGAYRSPFLRLANRLIPPNVFYLECGGAFGRLRCKYAVLSIAHFEKLVSRRTFHSYFWGRFAQPSRIVTAPPDLRPRIENAIIVAIETFIANAQGLPGADAGPKALFREGLQRSYRAELRAEPPERVEKLLDSYGDWPERVTLPVERGAPHAELRWTLRRLQGGLLSAARLLKASLTFEGGVDYIAWKISRHAGFSLPVKDWERKFPLLAAPFLASRYYRLKRRS